MIDIEALAWEKMGGLLPAVVQDASSQAVLMLGYMDKAALQATLSTKQVTFFSRSKKALWTKGETSGHVLALDAITILQDCDHDALLVYALPQGPTCHRGTTTCFVTNDPKNDWDFLQQMETVIMDHSTRSPEKSYIARLFAAGMGRMAQKVGEEGVEVALSAVLDGAEELCEEAADLLFHLLVLLKARGSTLSHVVDVLKSRAKSVPRND